MTVCGGGQRASARRPARRFSFLFMCIVSLPSFSRGLDFLSRNCNKLRRDAQTNAVSDGEGGYRARYSMLSSLIHCGGKLGEAESGEARFGEARIGGEAGRVAEVKAGVPEIISETATEYPSIHVLFPENPPAASNASTSPFGPILPFFPSPTFAAE